MLDPMHLWYDRHGRPITLMEWVDKQEDGNYKFVAHTRFGDDCSVSTVWLGLDYQFGDGPPLIFETMVFGGPLDLEQVRYPSEVAALAGHDQMVMAVREAYARSS